MRASKVFALSLFAAGVASRSFDTAKPDDSSATKWLLDGPGAQKPIHADSQDGKLHTNGWTVQEQDSRVCDAGSRQFSGRVNVTDDKSMFFWFFESQAQAKDKPVVIWLNGGPGASSMMGLFGAAGPCLLHPNASSTYRNVHSWTKYANMLFIDQPAGVGLSTVPDPENLPKDLTEASADFIALLDTIFVDIFPQFASNPIVIAGESFGGAYAPRYAFDIAQRRAAQRRQSTLKITGLILLNAVVSNTYITSGHYTMFCQDGGSPLRFNDTSCEAMAAAIPECERLQNICEITRDGQACIAAIEYCQSNIYTYFSEEVEAHRRSPYDVRRPCPHPPVCDAGDTGLTGSPSEYLGRRDIQELLGFNTHVNYTGINFNLNGKWSQQPSTYVPRTMELTNLLNSHTEILVINGNMDVAVNTPGIIMTYDNLPWNRQVDFRSQPLTKWTWTNEVGEELIGGGHKAVPGLEIYTVDDAGHMAAADQREAVSIVTGQWLRTIE